MALGENAEVSWLCRCHSSGVCWRRRPAHRCRRRASPRRRSTIRRRPARSTGRGAGRRGGGGRAKSPCRCRPGRRLRRGRCARSGWAGPSAAATATTRRRRLERRSDLQIDGAFGAGHLGHFGPEIGYQWRERIALSLQTRHQVIPRQVTDPTQVDGSQQWAHTLLGRGIYLFRDIHPRFHLYTGGVVGVGRGLPFPGGGRAQPHAVDQRHRRGAARWWSVRSAGSSSPSSRG